MHPVKGGAEEEPAGVHPVKGRRGGTSRGAPSQGAQRGSQHGRTQSRNIEEEPAGVHPVKGCRGGVLTFHRRWAVLPPTENLMHQKNEKGFFLNLTIVDEPAPTQEV